MESALTSALVRSGRLVDLVYAGLVHQLGITQRFFPQGFGRLDLIDFHADVQQFQQWPPAHFEQQLPWKKLVADNYGGHGYKVFKASFKTPCQGQVYDALPPESRTAHAMLILPDRPAEGAPCVVHLAATGDHGYARRSHLGLPLVKQGIATLALESPFYGQRKPHYQQGSKLLHVSDLLLLGRATIEESLLLLHWLGQAAGHERLGVCGLSMGGVHANMVASLYPGPLALTPLLSPRSAAGAYCSGALYHATAWSQILEDLKSREESVAAALQHAGRGSELMGHARWWVDSRSEAAKEEAGQRQRQAEEAEAATAAAAASGEVQAAQHATAVQAASRAETQAAEGDSSGSSSSSAGGRAGPAGAAAVAASATSSSSSSSSGGSSDKSSSAWHWRAIGRWAERVSSELRAQVGQVEKLEKDQQHEAAVARLHAVLETYTDVTRFPKPQRADAAVIVGAQQDAYVSPQSVLELQQHLTGSEVRWVPGGHVTSFLLHHNSFRQAIVDSLAKLAQPPPLVKDPFSE